MDLKDLDSLLDEIQAPRKIYAGRKIYFNDYQKAIEFSEKLVQNSGFIYEVDINLKIYPFHEASSMGVRLKRSNSKSLKSQTIVSFQYNQSVYSINSESKVIKDLIIEYNTYIDAMSGCDAQDSNHFHDH